MGRLKKYERTGAPLLRVRHLAAIMVVLATLVIGPLCVVWKQVYITELSMRQKKLADSLTALNKQSAGLRLAVENLSGTERIESIARERLGLEYPPANRIVIIREPSAQATAPENGRGFFASVRSLFAGEAK